jgi:16S rRNA (guanine966-N2)-methyltransferase
VIRIIGGDQKGLRLKTPKGTTTRPTQEKLRKSVFDIVQFSVPDANFLDVFAGSGAMGIEALSRGAARATFVEIEQKAIQCIKDNLKHCNLHGSVKKGDACKVLETLTTPFDLIYIDPPYNKVGQMLTKVLQVIEKRCLLAQGGRIFAEIGAQEEWEGDSSLKHLQLEKCRPFGSTTLLQIFFPEE